MQTSRKSSLPPAPPKKAAIVFLSVILALLVAVVAFAVVYRVLAPEDDRPILSAEELRANMEAGGGDFSSTCAYLEHWGFPPFDARKYKLGESVVIRHTLYELPTYEALAKKCGGIFLDESYGEIDLTDKDEVTDALLSSLVATLGDRYAFYRTADEYENYSDDMSGSFSGVGITVQYTRADGQMLVTGVSTGSPAEEVGIRAGDLLVAIDGETIEELGYTAAINRVRGKTGSTVRLTLTRGGVPYDVEPERRPITEICVTHEIREDETAYIRITAFKDVTFPQFRAALDECEAAGVRGVVFDLRDNPGGYLNSIKAVLSYLVPDGTAVASFDGYSADLFTGGDPEGDHALALPCVVLCNRNTASAGELFTAALRDYGSEDFGLLTVKTVGETTYKKGIMQNTYQLGDGSAITLTVARYNPPSGVNYDGVGVVPEISVEGDDAAFLSAADEALAALLAD